MNTPSSRPLHLGIEYSKFTTSKYDLYYNFETLYNLNFQKITTDDVENDVQGIKVKQSITSHKCIKFEDFEYNYVDLVLMRKQDEYGFVISDDQDSTNSKKYKYSVLIRTATDNFRQKLHIEIPIHNYEDISNNAVLSRYIQSPQNTLVSEIIQSMHDNKSEIESGETIEYKPKTLFNLNDFIGESEYFLYNYSSGNSLYKYVFFERDQSQIVVLDDFIKLIDELLSYTNEDDVTKQLINSDNLVTYNIVQIKQSMDVSKENLQILPEIYIDCQPSDDTNGSDNVVSYLSKSMVSDDTKKVVDSFLTFILNILIVFVVVYFMYYKLPSFINF